MIANNEEGQPDSQRFRMRVFEVMGNRRYYIIEYDHMHSKLEFELIKVTSLNLFHLIAPPHFQKAGFSYYKKVSAGSDGDHGAERN